MNNKQKLMELEGRIHELEQIETSKSQTIMNVLGLALGYMGAILVMLLVGVAISYLS